jgi:hypothetical protein
MVRLLSEQIVVGTFMVRNVRFAVVIGEDGVDEVGVVILVSVELDQVIEDLVRPQIVVQEWPGCVIY